MVFVLVRLPKGSDQAMGYPWQPQIKQPQPDAGIPWLRSWHLN